MQRSAGASRQRAMKLGESLGHRSSAPVRTIHEEKQLTHETPLPAVSANTLARCLGLTPKTIYDLAKTGILVRGDGRLFALEKNVRRYCEHLRQTISHKSQSASDAV